MASGSDVYIVRDDLSTVQAASGIEMDRVCSVSFVLDGDIEEEFAELKSLPVSVKLYKVAEVGNLW